MRRLATLLLVTTFIAISSSPVQAQRKWTVLGWFVSDDNKNASLEESQLKNMDELAERGSGDGYDVAIQVDRGNKISDYLKSRYSDPDYSGAKRYHIERDRFVMQEKLGEVNMGDPAELLDFLRWGAKNYPAEHYLLVINAHGSGVLSWRGPGSTADSEPGRVVLPGRALRQYAAYDDTDNDCLTVFEIQEVLRRFAEDENGGRKLDMMALDACLAAAVEALYQFRDGLDYLVASPTTVPGHGFDYRAILGAIASNPSVTPRELGEVIAESFIRRATNGNVLGCFATAGIDELVQDATDMAREMWKAGQEVGRSAFSNIHSYSGDKYWDLDDIAWVVSDNRTDLTRASNAAALVDAAKRVRKSLKAVKTSLWYSGQYADAKSGGLSIFWPTAQDYRTYRSFYKATDFAKASVWDEFLDWRELR